jgi:hypothetical protein
MTWIGQARKRNQILGAINYDGGLNVPQRLDLRNSGYLERLWLAQAYSFQYGTAGPGSADAFGQMGGTLNRITLQSNSVGLLYDTSGEMNKVIAAVDDFQRTGSGEFEPAPNTFSASPATSAKTNVWASQVPIAVYFKNKPWPIGLYQMALNALEVSLELRFRPLNATASTPGSGVYVPASNSTIAAALAGAVYIQQQYFDPIADPASQPTLAFVHQWREFQVPITADGDLDIRLPPSNLYMRMLYLPVLAGALTTFQILQKLQLRYGANFAPFEERGVSDSVNGNSNVSLGLNLQNRMNRELGQMPTVANAAIGAVAGEFNGLLVHDFFSPTSDERDFINSAATTDLRTTLTTSGGTYTSPSYVKVAVEQLIPLVVPQAGAGNVQGVS